MENNDLIVINKQELNTEYVNNRIKEEKVAKKDLNKSERIPVQNSIFFNPIFYTAVCGILAALMGWGCTEPFIVEGREGYTFYQFLGNHITINYSFLGMVVLITMLLGAAISSFDSLMSGNIIKTLKTGSIGLCLGAVSGVVLSYFVANKIFSSLLYFNEYILLIILPHAKNYNSTFVDLIWVMISRAPAWAVLGAGIGILPGISNFSLKLFFNGLIGGLIGGFLGGFLFDPILLLTKNISSSGVILSRGIGFSVLGLMIGVFVGLVENMAKDVWVTMKSGPLRGKQFVIYHNPTLIGSSPRSDIYIFKDSKVMPTHAKIQKRGNKYEIIDNSKGVGVYVNSKKINESKILEDNDEIILGQSILEFQQKERI